MGKENQLKGEKIMDFLLNLLQLPSVWLLVIGLIILYVIIKVIRSIVEIVLSLVFTAFSLYRVYLFLQNYL